MTEHGGLGRDSAQPLDPTNPLSGVDPGQPVDPVSPDDPVAPVAAGDALPPVNPADPMAPRVPVVRERPLRTWLWPTLLVFGFVIGVALVVMVLVSSADFDEEPARVTPTPGACAPFCTNTPVPPAP